MKSLTRRALPSSWRDFLIRHRGLSFLLALLLLFGLVSTALAQTAVVIDWQVIAGGGGSVQGGSILINDTFGQPLVGTSSSYYMTLNAGYWSAIPPEFNIYLPIIER